MTDTTTHTITMLNELSQRLKAVESRLTSERRVHELSALADRGLPEDAIGLTVADVAHLMNKSTRTIRRYLEIGALKPSGVEGAGLVITLAEVRRFLRETKEART